MSKSQVRPRHKIVQTSDDQLSSPISNSRKVQKMASPVGRLAESTKHHQHHNITAPQKIRQVVSVRADSNSSNNKQVTVREKKKEKKKKTSSPVRKAKPGDQCLIIGLTG